MTLSLVVALVLSTPADDLDLALDRRAAGEPVVVDTPAERLAALVGSTDDAGMQSPEARALELEVIADARPHLLVLEDWLLRRLGPELDVDQRAFTVAGLLRLVAGAEPEGTIAAALERLISWPWSRRDDALTLYRIMLRAMEPGAAADLVTDTYGARGDDFDSVAVATVERQMLRSSAHLERFLARLDAHPDLHPSSRVTQLRELHEAQRVATIDEREPRQVVQRLAQLPLRLLRDEATLGADDRRRLARVTSDGATFGLALATLVDAIDPQRLDEGDNSPRAYSTVELARRTVAEPSVRHALVRLLDRLHRPPQRSETSGHRSGIARLALEALGRTCDIGIARVLLDSLAWLDDEYLIQDRSNWLGNLCAANAEVRERVRALAQRRLPNLEKAPWFTWLVGQVERAPSPGGP